jgi:capsid protein
VFEINNYIGKLQERNLQLNERMAELQSNLQLITSEMKFIELEIAGLDGQLTALKLVKESTASKTVSNEIKD